MEADDDKPRRAGPLDEVEREDLDGFSRAELGERIDRLKCEITRAESKLATKGSLQSEAESLFKSV